MPETEATSAREASRTTTVTPKHPGPPKSSSPSTPRFQRLWSPRAGGSSQGQSSAHPPGTVLAQRGAGKPGWKTNHRKWHRSLLAVASRGRWSHRGQARQVQRTRRRLHGAEPRTLGFRHNFRRQPYWQQVPRQLTRRPQSCALAPLQTSNLPILIFKGQ